MNEQHQYNDELIVLQDHIMIRKNYSLVLHKRLVLIREDYALKTEHEKNEVEIGVYETLIKLNQNNSRITEMETTFEHRFNAFANDLEQLYLDYDKTIELAKKKQAESISIKHVLYHANWKVIGENIIEKIEFYKNLKQLL